MGTKPSSVLGTIAALALVACSAAGPKTAEITSRAVPAGHGRLYVLREKQAIYSVVPVTVSADGRSVGTLSSGTYLATDLPAGAHTLVVAILLSRVTTGFDLMPGKAIYVGIAMTPSGLPPPRGAVGAAPAYPISAAPGLFSLSFLDAGAATTALADLLPSD